MRPALLALVFLLLLPVLPVSTASALTYTFTRSNAFGDWTDAVPPGYGYIDISKGAEGWLYLEVGANDDFFAAAEPGLTWDKFFFNAGQAIDPSAIVVEEPGNWNLVFDRNVSSFGRFDLGLEGTALGNYGIDPLRFRIEDASLGEDFAAANAEGWMFAGHLKRFGEIDGQESNYLGSGTSAAPVPEPATLLLLGAGLGGLVMRRRRAG